MARTNLITNPSFETNTTGWGCSNATASTPTRVVGTGAAVVGTAYAQATASAAGELYVYRNLGGSSIPVTPGQVYRGSVAVARNDTATAGDRAISVGVEWYTSGGALVAQHIDDVAYTGSAFVRRGFSGVVAPAGAAVLSLTVTFVGMPAGAIGQIDAAIVELATGPAPTDRPYFDGASPAHAWTGTAHASTSTGPDDGVRVNQHTNPSLETAATGHTVAFVRSGLTSSQAAGAAIGRQTTGGTPHGTTYGFTNLTGNGTSPATANDSDLDMRSAATAANAGDPFALSVSVSASPVGASVRAALRFLNSGGTVIATALGDRLTVTTDYQRATVTGTAPAGTTQVRGELWWTGSPDTTTRSLRADGWLLEQTAAVRPYFDGASPGAGWVGTANASASTGPEYRALTVGQALDASLARPAGRARSRSLEQAGDTSSASAVPVQERAAIRTATDTGLAQPVARARRRPIGQVIDSSAATLLGRGRTRAISTAGEPTVTRPVARQRRRVVALTVDSGPGQIVRRLRRRAVGQPGQFDIASQLPESALGQVSDADFAAAIAAPERRPLAVFRIDWDSSGYADGAEDYSDNLRSIEVERATDGDLPAGAGLIDGYATATVKAELGGTRPGASMPLSAELSPFRPDSPLYGHRKTLRQALVELGFITEQGVRIERMFSGPLRNIAIGEGSGEVTMDGVDPSELIRSLVTLPTYGEFVTHASRREWKLTVNSQAVVDLCLRYNGIFASPPPHPEAIISCTGHGGLFAEIGFNGAPISIYGSGPAAGLWTEDQHPYGMLGTPESPTGGTVGYQEFYGRSANRIDPPVRFQAGNGVGLSCLLHAGDYMTFGASVENRLFQIRITEREYPRLFVNVMGNGQVYGGLTTGAGSIFATPKISTGAARWKFFGVHFRWTTNTTLVVTYRLNGTTTSYTLTVPAITITPTPFFAGYRPILQVNGHMSRAWSNLSVWPNPNPPAAGPWWGESHVPQADIGRGHNELTYLPDVAAQDSWEVLKAVTAAEYAVHGFTEYGRYYWRPRSDVRPDRIDHLFDVDTNLADVAYSYSSDTIRNSIGIELAPKFHSGQVKTVVETKDVDQARVPGRSIRIFELDWPHGAAGVQSGILPYCYQAGAATEARDAANGFPKWPQPHGWTYSSIGASGGYTILDNTRSVVVSFVQVDARRVQIRITNPGPGPIRLATAADPADLEGKPGEPAMHIGGWPLEAATTRVVTYRNEASIAELGGQFAGGERSLPIQSSEWRQHEPALAPVAFALLDALNDENPILEDLEVRGDPRIKVGNVAAGRFRAPEVVVVGTVVKTRHVVDERGYRTLVSLRPLPARTLTPQGYEFYVDISRFQAETSSPLDLGRLKVLGYAGCVAKIGQGAGTTAGGTTYAATIDPAWEQWRDTSLALWPAATAGYWYLGNTEAPADQAARCLEQIGDVAIPVMLDWEAGGGDFANLLACLDAFRAAGLLVTMVYASRSYAAANAPAGSTLAGRGVSLISARYWVDTPGAFPDPRADFDDQPVGFGFEPFLGVTPAANQFTQWGTPYDGSPYTDIDAFRGTATQLSSMLHGEPY